MSFAFDVKCFFGTIKSVVKHEGVVEGGTGEIKREKAKSDIQEVTSFEATNKSAGAGNKKNASTETGNN